MLHTVALNVEDDDNTNAYILCTCGELFETNKEGEWEWAVNLMAAHLKEANAEPQVVRQPTLRERAGKLFLSSELASLMKVHAPRFDKADGVAGCWGCDWTHDVSSRPARPVPFFDIRWRVYADHIDQLVHTVPADG